jgi:SWI/SNF-related matrix-associated actin-dependent regulator 1 of chromatin subfamily A
VSDPIPTRCALDDKPVTEKDEGVCAGCRAKLRATAIKVSPAEVSEVVSEAPEPLRSDLQQEGDLTQPAAAREAILSGLWHVAQARQFGAPAIDSVAKRVDEAKLVIASVHNLARLLGYDDVAKTIMRRLGDKDIIRFRAERGTMQVHAPFNERWALVCRENNAIFFDAKRDDRGFFWRSFHPSELRRVANLLMGVFGDQLCLATNGRLLALPSMPLPKEYDFGEAPTGKPRATGEVEEEIPEESAAIRIGDKISLPGGGESIVQFVNPKKKLIGVGDTKGNQYTFYSFEEVETANGRAIAARLNAERKAAAAVEGRKVEDIVIQRQLPVGIKNYQIESVNFIEKHRRVILGDEPGLGKTLVCLTCIDTPAIVITTATTKYNWVDEAKRWRPDLVSMVVNGTAHPSELDIKRANMFILNYDIVDKHLPWLLALGAKTLIADEAQNLRNLKIEWDKKNQEYVAGEKSPNRAVAFYKLHHNIPKLILATGTPVMNRTKELFPLLHMCNKQEWASQKAFYDEFCGAFERDTPNGKVVDANGRTNTEELHKRLVERYMIRHRKDDVLTELPPKRRWSEEVPLSDKWRLAYLQLAKSFEDWIYVHGGPEKVESSMRAEALVKMTALRRLSANGKVPAALNYIQNHLEGTGFRPIIVMAEHTEAFTALGKGLDAMNAEFDADVAAGRMPAISRKIRWAGIFGADGLKKRVKTYKQFQFEGTIDVLLFSIQLAQGLNCTRAQDMLFLERLWRPSDQVQAEDRAHRVGQTGSLGICYLDGMGTIDQFMATLLADKTDTIARVVNGELLSADEVFMSIFGQMVSKDGQPRKPKMVGSLSELLDELFAARDAMEKQKAELVSAKMARGMSEKEAKKQAKAEIGEDIDEYAAKRRKGLVKNSSMLAGELYPKHARDRAHYESMKDQPSYQEALAAMVVASWNNPLP